MNEVENKVAKNVIAASHKEIMYNHNKCTKI